MYVIAFQEPPIKQLVRTIILDLLSSACVSRGNPYFKPYQPCYLTFNSQSHNMMRFIPVCSLLATGPSEGTFGQDEKNSTTLYYHSV